MAAALVNNVGAAQLLSVFRLGLLIINQRFPRESPQPSTLSGSWCVFVAVTTPSLCHGHSAPLEMALKGVSGRPGSPPASRNWRRETLGADRGRRTSSQPRPCGRPGPRSALAVHRAAAEQTSRGSFRAPEKLGRPRPLALECSPGPVSDSLTPPPIHCRISNFLIPNTWRSPGILQRLRGEHATVPPDGGLSSRSKDMSCHVRRTWRRRTD